MGNLVDLPSINAENLVFENSGSTEKKTSNFSLQNYLNVRLDKGETKKTLTIRLLPMNLETGNPFALVHMHNVKVPKEVSPSGYKAYVCLSKNRDIDHDKYGHKCPFCEINQSAYKESEKTTDPLEKKKWQEISIANLSREAVIVRCIERGKEDEGVKFWKFNLRKDKSDPYNVIMNLYNLRKESGINIFDYEKGCDLIVTINEGKNAPTIVDGRVTPLSTNYEQAKAWIYDSKKWQDVFVAKTYEYLKLVSEMRIPWFDKEKGLWVDKEEFDATHDSYQKKSDDEIRNAEAIAKGTPPVDETFMNSITLDDTGSTPDMHDPGEEELPF